MTAKRAQKIVAVPKRCRWPILRKLWHDLLSLLF